MNYAAFLRAVNVTGHNRITMDRLKKVFLEAGYTDVVSYLQSGNIVFTCPQQPTKSLEAALETLLSQQLKLSVAVFVKSKKDIASCIQQNPFVDAKYDRAFLHVTFTKGTLSVVDTGSIIKSMAPREEFKMTGSSIYLYCPHGYGRTKLSTVSWEKWTGGVCTTRNWKTMLAINSLLQD